jgi:hypothetical protein
MESKELLRSIKKFSGIDIKGNRSRKRPVVEAKQLYSKLMRDAGYTYQEIGKSIGLNHATILFHFKSYDYVKMSSPSLRELESNVLSYVFKDDTDRIISEIEFHKEKIKDLEELLSQSTKNV